jgi:hypothetical protein
MKKIYTYLLTALVLAFLAGCSNPFVVPKASPETAAPPTAAGTGLALINLAGTKAARTLFPSIAPAEFYYVLTFTPGAGTPGDTLTEYVDRSSSKSLELAAGDWTLDVKGYIDADHAEGAPEDPGVTGSASFTVPAEGRADVPVTLSAAGRTEYGKGELAYTVSFPAGVISAELSLINITATGDKGPVNMLLAGVTEAEGVKTASGVVPEVWAGFYRMVLDLSVQIEGVPSRTLRTRVVRIHDSLRTKAEERFTEASFFKGRKFDTLEELKTYLDGLEQNTGDNPYPVALSAMVDLSGAAMDSGDDDLGNLYAALTRYTALDLSECQGTIIGKDNSGKYTTRTNGPNLVSVILPPGLTRIGQGAFYSCTSLGPVDLPSGITVIGYGAFQGCESLTSITWPAALTSVGGRAFEASGLSGTLVFPANCTNFGEFPFNNTGITAADLSAVTNLTTIGTRAFVDCKQLREVILPSTGKNLKIDSFAFSGCESLDTMNWDAISPGVFTLGSAAFSGTAFTSLPSFARFVSTGQTQNTFSGMKNLTSVDMSAWAGTTLTTFMFSGCVNLESITLGPNITTIPVTAFQDCPKIRFYPGANTNFTASADHVLLLNAAGTTLVAGNSASGSVTVPAGVTSIATSAFAYCTALTEIIFPGTLSSIGADAFSGCTGLTELTLSDGLTTIGARAFENSGIEVVTLPSTLTSITTDSSHSFKGSPLKKVKIPYNLAYTLTRLSFPGVVYELLPPGGSGGYELFEGGKLIVKNHAVLFAATEFSGPLTLDASITSIAAEAFYSNTGVTSVDMSACTGLTSIGNSAFRGTTNLAAVTFPASLTLLDTYAFTGSGLTTVDLSGCTGLTSIGGAAFSGATALTTVTFPPSLQSIGGSAFQSTGFTTVDLSAYTGLTTIGANAFQSAAALTAVTFPPSLTSIGTYAFEATGLRTLTLPASLVSIGNYAFQNTASLEWVKWPVSATNAYIGRDAFKSAAKLSRVELPDNLRTSSGSSDCGLFGGAFTGTDLRVLIVRSSNAGLYGGLPDGAYTVYVPDANVNTYKTKVFWSGIASKIFGISTLPAQDEPGNWN